MANLRILVSAQREWKKPKPAETLIFNVTGASILLSVLEISDFSIFDKSLKIINMNVFLRSFTRKIFKKISYFEAYVDTYISVIGAKLVLTFIDNDPNFYTISQRNNAVVTAFIQNGWRTSSGDIFCNLSAKLEYKVDLMFVLGEAIGKKYAEYISGEVIPIGSLISNEIPRNESPANNSVIFISQWQDRNVDSDVFIFEHDGTKVTWDEFFQPDVAVVQLLYNWCSERNLELIVCGRRSQEVNLERDFYKSLIRKAKWRFEPKKTNQDTYWLIDSAALVVFVNSTLGYEAVARGKKVVSFSARQSSLHPGSYSFGWPAKIPFIGPFWTDQVPSLGDFEILNAVWEMTDLQWQNQCRLYVQSVVAWDLGNGKLKSEIAKILQS